MITKITLIILVFAALLLLSCSDPVSPTVQQPKDYTSLGNARTSWHPASRPVQLDSNHVRGKILWHMPREAVGVDDVYDCDVGAGEATMRTFRMIIRPQHSVLDTIGFNADTTGIITDTVSSGHPSWAGIMRYLGLDISPRTINYFEVRARGTDCRMHIEFGLISDDVNGDGFWASEDEDMNGAVSEEEDTGVDGLADSEESEFYHPVANPDPHGDNWYIDGHGKCPLPPDQCANYPFDDDDKRYEWLNGTEGNWQDISVLGNPDREQLAVWQSNYNAYFSYTVDFASDSFLVPGSVRGGWRSYRIPLPPAQYADTTVQIADQTEAWSSIERVRVWFEADENRTSWDTVEVADWFIYYGTDTTSVLDPCGRL